MMNVTAKTRGIVSMIIFNDKISMSMKLMNIFSRRMKLMDIDASKCVPLYIMTFKCSNLIGKQIMKVVTNDDMRV